MAMHLLLDLPELPDPTVLGEIVALIHSTGGQVHSFRVHPPVAGVHEHAHEALESLGMLLDRLSLTRDDCTLLGTSPGSQAAASRARVRFARLRPPSAWTSSTALDADFASLHEALGWFQRQSRLETCGWPIATVGGLVFGPDARAYFVRTAKWSGKWGTPGGKIDYGETHGEAFVREMHEETGLLIQSPRLVLVQEALEDPDFYKKRHFLLLNLVARTLDTAVQLNHESLDGRWMTLEESLECDLNKPTRLLVRHLLDHPGDLP
jgi:8-oxo-dGTP pyrophosphatase MutT (NUDIX family)